MASVFSQKKSEMAFVDGAVDPAVASGIAASATASATAALGAPESDAAPVPASILGKMQYYYRKGVDGTRWQLSLVRPWRDFFDKNSFSAPSGLTESLSRLNRNINHYYHNYIILALIGSSYVLLLNPAFSICIFLTVVMWWYVNARRADAAAMNSNHFMIGNYAVTFSQAYLFIIAFGCISFFLSGGSSVVFWLALSSLGIVSAHAVMRRPAVEEQPFSFV